MWAFSLDTFLQYKQGLKKEHYLITHDITIYKFSIK